MYRRMSLALLTALFLSACGSSGVSEETQSKIDEVRKRVAEVKSILPERGSEANMEPEQAIPNLGVLEGFESHGGVPALDENFMQCVIDGSKNVSEVTEKGNNRFTEGPWHALEPDAIQGTYDMDNLEEDIDKLTKANHMAVIRTVDLDKGEYGGGSIKRPGKFKGWLFLVDVREKKVVASHFMEVETDNSIFSMTDGSENILFENLKKNVRGRAQFYVNTKWGGDAPTANYGIYYMKDKTGGE